MDRLIYIFNVLASKKNIDMNASNTYTAYENFFPYTLHNTS
jgi:hypothetical protein